VGSGGEGGRSSTVLYGAGALQCTRPRTCSYCYSTYGYSTVQVLYWTVLSSPAVQYPTEAVSGDGDDGALGRHQVSHWCTLQDAHPHPRTHPCPWASRARAHPAGRAARCLIHPNLPQEDSTRRFQGSQVVGLLWSSFCLNPFSCPPFTLCNLLAPFTVWIPLPPPNLTV